MAPWGERRFLVDCWLARGLTANSIGWSSRGLAKLAGDRADKGSEGAGAPPPPRLAGSCVTTTHHALPVQVTVARRWVAFRVQVTAVEDDRSCVPVTVAAVDQNARNSKW